MSESEQVPETDTDVFAADLDEDVWAEEPTGSPIVARVIAELGGTFILVFMGLGAAFFAGNTNASLTIAFAFGIGMVIAFVVFSGISGAHVNPAVTVGVWIAGRFPGRDVLLYILGQVVGGAAAAGAMAALLSSLPQIPEVAPVMAAAANGYGSQSPAGFAIPGVLIIEVLVAAFFVAVFLAATSLRAKASAATAPITIGLAFGFLLMVAIPFSNGGLNPARSTAAAIFAGTDVLQQLWVFWVASLIGAALTGLLVRAFGPEEDLIIIEQTKTVETIEVIED